MDKYPYVIGSFEKMSDVVIKAQVVSRMHCCIYHEAFKDDEYWLRILMLPTEHILWRTAWQS